MMHAIVTFSAFAFCAWMFYDCTKYERGNFPWILVIFLFNILGAMIYFCLRWLPRMSPALENFLNRGTQQRELQDAISAARNIGNAYQFAKLGSIYLNRGRLSDAIAAYQQALKRQPENLEALWGSASIEIKNNNLAQAICLLQQLVDLQPDFKFGDASLAYSKVLFSSGDFNAAQCQLERHLKHWNHPEAFLLIAQIQAHYQNSSQACDTLNTMIENVQGSPPFYYRKHRMSMLQAQKLLKTFGRERPYCLHKRP